MTNSIDHDGTPGPNVPGEQGGGQTGPTGAGDVSPSERRKQELAARRKALLEAIADFQRVRRWIRDERRAAEGPTEKGT